MKLYSSASAYRLCLAPAAWFTVVNLCLLAASAVAAERPNILFIMADDHSQAAISCYGSKVIQTPNIDRLAQAGMRFQHMVAAEPRNWMSLLPSGRYVQIHVNS